jgi:hypothetical protein
MASLRRKGGLGKGPERAHRRAERLAEIGRDWNCSWPLDRQRRYRVLAADAPDGHLPDIAPGVLFEGEDIGTWRWRQREPGTWTQLLPKQQKRLTSLRITPSA